MVLFRRLRSRTSATVICQSAATTQTHSSFPAQVYGPTPTYPNQHVVLHIPEDIDNFGPVYVVWTMTLESALRDYKGEIEPKRFCTPFPTPPLPPSLSLQPQTQTTG